jgi:hypothetical protein
MKRCERSPAGYWIDGATLTVAMADGSQPANFGFEVEGRTAHS